MVASRWIARSTAPPPSSRARSSTSGPPRRMGRRSRVSRSPASSSSWSISASSPTRSCVARTRRIDSRDSRETPCSARSWPYRSASPSPITARVKPTASNAAGQDLDHLGRSVGGIHADQLHPGLHELPHLPTLGTDRAVRIAHVAEPERWLGIAEPRRDQARDRHGHVGAHGQKRPVLVEESVGGRSPALVAPSEHLVVLDRGRRDLAVPEPLERVSERRLEAPKLAHLVGKDVPGTGGNSVNHSADILQGSRRRPVIRACSDSSHPASPDDRSLSLPEAGCNAIGTAGSHSRSATSSLAQTKAYAGTGSTATRSILAPRSRNRRSMRS